MKTPEEVRQFLDETFAHMTLYPAVKGFALFMLSHKNLLPLIVDEMDKMEADKHLEKDNGNNIR